jgi:hypothetical protein
LIGLDQLCRAELFYMSAVTLRQEHSIGAWKDPRIPTQRRSAVVRNKFRSALRSHLLEPVLVVESAQNGNASDRVIVRNTVTMLVVWYECRQPRREIRAQTHVRSGRVEMSNPGLQHIPEVPLIERNNSPNIRGRMVPPKRSHTEFALGARTGVRSTFTPMADTCLSSSFEKMLSWSWMRKRYP